MKGHTAIVLDSWAIMAYFQDEPAAEAIAEAIADANASGIPLLVSVVNVGEVWYAMARRGSVKDADEIVRDIRDLGIRSIDNDWNLTKIAAGYKTPGGISYADCFAAALAKQANATLVTGDPEFKRLEREISISWL